MSRTLKVFEHGTLPVVASGDGLRAHEFDALVRFNDRHRGRYFEIGHQHLRARQFVGYVEVGDVAIEILPKVDRDVPSPSEAWSSGLLEMLRVALGLRLARLPHASQRLTRIRLVDLIAQAYLSELEPLLYAGLAKGYRTTQSNGAQFRGRLKLAEHLRENLVRADRFFVEYQTFDHDIVVNRALAAALDTLAAAALAPSIASAVAASRARFPEVETRGFVVAEFDRVRHTRATLRYATALDYARLILSHQGPQLRSGRERVFALLFDMNALWERYIATLMRRSVPDGLRVNSQEHHRFWLPKGRAVRKVKPDIVVRADAGANPVLVIDTKWKVPRNGLPSDEDLKQMFVYNELLGVRRSVLLYPATAGAVPAAGVFAIGKQHICEQRHVDPFAAGKWSSETIRAQLRALIQS